MKVEFYKTATLIPKFQYLNFHEGKDNCNKVKQEVHYGIINSQLAEKNISGWFVISNWITSPCL